MSETLGGSARFAFGENWARFLDRVDDARIAAAERSLAAMLETGTLAGRRFLDVGSGSGLFSLAAHRLGAEVVSFDLDPDSVACTAEMKRRHGTGDPAWRIARGSILDPDFVGRLGAFDVVYAWGVLHHTGDLWRALAATAGLVAPGGRLCLAVYNDQGVWSRAWRWIKRSYVATPRPLRGAILVPCLIRLWGPALVRDLAAGRGLERWRGYGRSRGMSPWHDAVDWVGGWPFEVARPEAIIAFHRARGFALRTIETCGGGRGNNEFVFERAPCAA